MAELNPTGAERRLAAALMELADVQLRLDTERLRRQDSDALFDRVFSAMSDAVFLVDPRGQISRANEAAVRFTGREQEELLGLRPDDLFGQEVPRSAWEIFRRALPESVDTHIRRGQGAPLPVSVSCAAVQDAHGKVVGAVYAARDISERKQAERHREAQLRVTRVLASSGAIGDAFPGVLEAVGESLGWDVATAWLIDSNTGELRCHDVWRATTTPAEAFARACERMPFTTDSGRVAALWLDGKSSWTGDLGAEPDFPRGQAAVEAGLHRAVWSPIASGGELLGVIELLSRESGPPESALVELLSGMAAQIGEFVERKRVEETLHKVELFQSAFQNAPVGMALFGVHGRLRGRLLQVNEALCRFLGYAPEALLERPLEETAHPEDASECRGSIARLLSEEIPTSALETRYVRSGGEVVTGILHCSLLRDQTGRALYGVAQVQDTTERRRAQDALSESRERLQAVLDNTKAAIYVKDLDGRYTLVNADAAALAGRPPEEIIGRTAHDLFSKQLADRLVAGDRAVLDSGESVRFEETLPLEGGTATYITQKFLLRDERGKAYALGGISTDITERVRVEQEKRQLEAELHRAQRLETVGRLAGGIAHDFNNLTVVVLNHAQLLEEELAHLPDAREGIAEIRKAAERTAALTQELVTFSKGQVVEPKVLDLNAVVQETGKLLQRAIGEDIALQTELAPDLWPLEADPSQLERVLLNLVMNARDAMSSGGSLKIALGNVSIGAEEAERLPEPIAPGRYVRISVSDTGCGMEEDVAARAFEPFFTTKGPTAGSGLGLATVYGVARQAGGRVELESAPGVGTTVSLYLPASERRPATQSEEPRREPGAGQGQTILVVEDEGAVRRLVARILSRRGYRVLEAPGPEEAVEEFGRQSSPLDLLLTDLVMPKMSGAELASTMSSLQPGLRVAFMSGYTDDVVIRHGLAEEPPLLLKKPFTPERLLGFVAKGLSSASSLR